MSSPWLPWKRWLTKYPGIRPEFSVMGTKINGQNAAPMFQLVVAQYSVGNFSCDTPNSSSIYSFPDPYAPAGRPKRIDLYISYESAVTDMIDLHQADRNCDGPFVSEGPVEWVLGVVWSIPINQLSSFFLRPTSLSVYRMRS